MLEGRSVRAAFDVPADPRNRGGRRVRGCFVTPADTVLFASSPAEVPAAVAEAERLARGGAWVVGGLRYEAGGAWDPAQAVHPGRGPLAHFEAYRAHPLPWPAGAPGQPVAEWIDDDRFGRDAALSAAAAIEAVRAHIAAGDCYQVNLTTRLRAWAEVDLWELFAGLVTAQPGGYAVFLRGAGVASASPELFFHHSPDTASIRTQPMKGTGPRRSDPAADAAAAAALAGGAKDRAENLMIVDLLRNDLSRVCEPGTVRVEALFELLDLPTVWQLTSTISGRAAPGTDLAGVFGTLFPCGSVTGAPKISAMHLIAELEPEPRGWYCGALGVIRPGGEAIFNVPIRTVETAGDTLVCGVGSGIVIDSDPVTERAEWRSKARFLGGSPLCALETMLLADGRIVRRERHLARLARTCTAFGLPLDVDAVTAGLARTVSDHPWGRFRVRLVVGDEGPRFDTSPAPADPVPVRLQLARRPLDTSGALRPLIVHKTTSRGHYQALREAAGPDTFDVICYTPSGELTECTTGNLALLLDGEWLTPHAAAGLLPGVLREELLESGRLREARLSVEDLTRAEQVVFLNSLRGWCPAVLAAD